MRLRLCRIIISPSATCVTPSTTAKKLQRRASIFQDGVGVGHRQPVEKQDQHNEASQRGGGGRVIRRQGHEDDHRRVAVGYDDGGEGERVDRQGEAGLWRFALHRRGRIELLQHRLQRGEKQHQPAGQCQHGDIEVQQHPVA